MSDGKEIPRQRRSWLGQLFAEALADRTSIAPATYASLNALVGMALMVMAVLVFDSRRAGAIVLGFSGVVLATGALSRHARPRVLVTTLGVHGVTLASLGVGLAASSVHWALWAPPETQFRYGPGLTLLLLTCAGLELALLPQAATRSRQLRRGGVGVGLILELLVLGALFVRAIR